VKSRKAEVIRRVHALPQVTFETHSLTSFGGLVVFQALFSALRLPARLRKCFAHLGRARVFGLARVVLQLVVHVLLGFRRLRDRDYYADDPLVCRVLGVRKLPDVSTITRTLAAADSRSVDALRDLVREDVLTRIADESLARVTADFDGSVLSTKGHAEGSAIGYNPKRKGARSYYPLFCVISQTGQFLDVLHRPGNCHDSNGAREFIGSCIGALRERVPRATLESRLDAAFYDDSILGLLDSLRVEYAAAVPFLRFPALKGYIAARQRWNVIDDEWAFFEVDDWRPKSWKTTRRLIIVRHRVRVAKQGPLQLDMFEPVERDYEYKAIVTNKNTSAGNVIGFFNGRGLQEATFAEAKQFAALDYIPSRRLVPNRIFVLASMLAHNLARELQMRTAERSRSTSSSRAALWAFNVLGTIRHLVVRRAGRLTRPAGRLHLALAASGDAKAEIERYLHHLQAA
jgi:hypothetical protein